MSDDLIGVVGENTAGQLKSIIERIERLNEEKQGVQDDIKEVYNEAKGNGFDNPTIRKIISMRKQDKKDREEQKALLETYCEALGIEL